MAFPYFPRLPNELQCLIFEQYDELLVKAALVSKTISKFTELPFKQRISKKRITNGELARYLSKQPLTLALTSDFDDYDEDDPEISNEAVVVTYFGRTANSYFKSLSVIEQHEDEITYHSIYDPNTEDVGDDETYINNYTDITIGEFVKAYTIEQNNKQIFDLDLFTQYNILKGRKRCMISDPEYARKTVINKLDSIYSEKIDGDILKQFYLNIYLAGLAIILRTGTVPESRIFRFNYNGPLTTNLKQKLSKIPIESKTLYSEIRMFFSNNLRKKKIGSAPYFSDSSYINPLEFAPVLLFDEVRIIGVIPRSFPHLHIDMILLTLYYRTFKDSAFRQNFAISPSDKVIHYDTLNDSTSLDHALATDDDILEDFSDMRGLDFMTMYHIYSKRKECIARNANYAKSLVIEQLDHLYNVETTCCLLGKIFVYICFITNAIIMRTNFLPRQAEVTLDSQSKSFRQMISIIDYELSRLYNDIRAKLIALK